jgi:hypothetical protein
MALINNQGEPISKWWVTKGLKVIKIDRHIFSSSNLRRARCEFIAGSNRLGTIKSWLSAAQLIDNSRNSREYELTDFGLAVSNNDSRLDKSATWWAFHLALCFSEDSQPYPSFFTSLENVSKDWVKTKDIFSKLLGTFKQENGDSYSDSTMESALSSVRRMFKDDRPLGDLGLIETQGDNVRLGSPKLTDEIIAHAVARMKFHCFKSRPSVSFSEVTQTGLAHFLCCSNDELRKHLRRIEQSNNWKGCFTFTEAVNVDSVSFGDECDPHSTVLKLLQSGEDTWL